MIQAIRPMARCCITLLLLGVVILIFSFVKQHGIYYCHFFASCTGLLKPKRPSYWTQISEDCACSRLDV